ncbi:hypothetical protein N7470_002779 [Penicillium chermesinum]|nr:hypothetical protein N7470_002779 [Penicillium chermesinum]
MDTPSSSTRNPLGSNPFPDLMNDPAFDERDRGVEDTDTCRICHGEATEDEPLFYPCKCSGSIKFVHQSCLVEWLAHSQKKHCELCKTHFRFTKLYDPNMPQSLPTPLFLRQALAQSGRTVLTWLRFLLVAFVWLGWLPWSMRAIWRALFWLADGRWSSHGKTTPKAGQLVESKNALTAGVTSTISLVASTASMPVVDDANKSPPASFVGVPGSEPLMLTLIRKMLPGFLFPGLSSPMGENGSSTTGLGSSSKLRYPSWLSDVKFLNTLTPYPTINNMIIDTLEGQLITLLVVIAFILLFLIREWVVQQQPMANIAEGEREAALQLIANANNRANDPAPHPEAQEMPAAPVFRPLPRPAPANQNQGEEFADENDPPTPPGSPPSPWADLNNPAPPNENPLGLRASFPEDLADTLAPVSGSSAAQNMETPPLASVATFRDILARANGDRDEMERIIHEHGLEDELEWIMNAFDSTPNDRNMDTPLHQADEPNSPGLHARDTFNPDINLDPGPQWPTQQNGHPPHREVNQAEPTPAPPANTDEQVEPQAPKGISEQLLDFFWGDITLNENDNAGEAALEDDEHIVQDPAMEEPFVPVLNRQDDQAADGAEGGEGDGGVDPNDVDAIEGDDFEGIMDLIGMQGPIFGLLQNGVFCALLIAFTVAIGIWLPYLWGKIALVLLANPLELIVGVPMTALTVLADIALDTLVGVVGYIMYWLTFTCKLLLRPIATMVPVADWIPQGKSVTNASLSLIDASTNRLNKVVKAFLLFHESDIPMFSVLSHQALRLHQARLGFLCKSAFSAIKFVLHDFPLRLVTLGIPDALFFDVDFSQVQNYTVYVQQQIGNFTRAQLYSSPGAKLINAGTSKALSGTASVDYDLAVWDSKDRAIAIAMGYLLTTIMGFLYLRITGILTGANRGQRIEGIVADVLIQAGGVMKVILIIGIEMIVFPLYCGTLLDIALLPLFSDATVVSRLEFTTSSPLTSLFVHWFIGTCYMFHFALFVSMCPKNLARRYFIRDPDDPTFHPIRDVLERSITTQLRKIGFSALVYGALVIVCLGGVVWGLHYAFDGVLPIHWSARAPMLEFPVDLLFYNFIMPVLINSVKPSDGLHSLYDWWFHKCAHFLRLSNFFFPDRHREEEGRHVRRTWRALFLGAKGDWEHPVIGDDQRAAAEKEDRDVYFLRDGRYVRAPASDQVRIPKGTQVFLDVTENNERLDGKFDAPDGLHGRNNKMFTMVYIPPNFRLRIAAFILLIWLFAAATGVGITVIPLIIGRRIISACFSSPVPVNDIYAFSSGLCVAGAAWCLVHYCRIAYLAVREDPSTYMQSPQQFIRVCVNTALDVARLGYISAALVVLLPIFFGLLAELYVLIPIHTFLGAGESHVVHIVQDWTLGVLYIQMAIKLILWNRQSWAAAVLNGIFRDGWLHPNASVATRALVIPASIFTALAVALPLLLGSILRWTVFYSHVELQPYVYRYSFPAMLSVVLGAWAVNLLLRRIAAWRVHVRDDVYLIGERLHNFSEKRARDVGVSRRVITQ